MKKLPQIILIISSVFTVIFLYLDFDFLELVPLVIFLLAINFYLIYTYDSILLNYILNSLLIIFLIICFSFGAILRQDWHFME
ncbi:Uncharacterised protein [Chryseobacterium nakagawai]|nr:Uncharacterised protein [Chryseobacterium nakagawai]